MALMKPEAQLPTVHPFAAVLYQDELFNLQEQSSLNYLAPEELSTTVEKVSAVALLNQALETKDLELTQDRLRNPSIDFNNLDEAHLERYASRLMSIKREASSQGQDNLRPDEMQNQIDRVNEEIQEAEIQAEESKCSQFGFAECLRMSVFWIIRGLTFSQWFPQFLTPVLFGVRGTCPNVSYYMIFVLVHGK
ncbi:ras GTPase-activating-like protein IQGAP2 [Monodelphis domestica]|uniref:ras GTPase-activating-like protein IQGAP2 n=1 Tax=Monodelphis domestica TaxID=13616 RepID=UPI0024E20878|nr:ras GTPase-activating-like protein IQGAP2 [Monodelphis domestica]